MNVDNPITMSTLPDYANATFVEVFFDYCVSGIDFSLPGNGGPECRDGKERGRASRGKKIIVSYS